MITPLGPTTVVIVIVYMDYISELAIHYVYPPLLCKGNVQHFAYSELYGQIVYI